MSESVGRPLSEFPVAFRPVAPFSFSPHLERFTAPGLPTPYLYDPGERRLSLLVLAEGRLLPVSLTLEGEPWSPLIRGRIWAPTKREAEAGRRALEEVVRARFDYERFAKEVCGLDEGLCELVRRYPGLRPGRCLSLYAALVDSVVKQRIALRAALRVYSRLVQRYGARVEAGGETFYWHPLPERLADEDPARLRELGLTRVKARALVEVARAEAEGRLPGLEEALRDPDSTVESLTNLYGVGEWTARLALAMVAPDFPLGPLSDLAVARGLALVVGADRGRELGRRVVEGLPGLGGLVLYLAAFDYEGRRGGRGSPPRASRGT